MTNPEKVALRKAADFEEDVEEPEDIEKERFEIIAPFVGAHVGFVYLSKAEDREPEAPEDDATYQLEFAKGAEKWFKDNMPETLEVVDRKPLALFALDI